MPLWLQIVLIWLLLNVGFVLLLNLRVEGK